MLISLDWIKDFTEIPLELSPSELGIKLTMATAEVEEVVCIGDFWEKICVVEVVKKEKHPEADKLNLVTFKISESETSRVVCGANNVEIGMKAAYAPVGVTLPTGLTLEARKIRGVLSEGMLCSEEELGLAESSEGIMKLDSKAPLGQKLLDYFDEGKDVLFDIDNKSLTHRPDLWGHYGMAREFSAIFKNPLKNPFTTEWIESLRSLQSGAKTPIVVNVDEDSSCLGYFGLSVDNVEIGESPQWLKRRLKSVGLRPINNIVDISNYVMLELGHPLHIFDRETIRDGVVHIKRLGKEEIFLTLDEVERLLVPEDTVISDSKGPLVLAGIMGGLNSGVIQKTKNIFIEVANWKAAEVRKTSARLGLRTDSSQRFEKTLDSLLMERTLLRTLELVKQLCPQAKVVGQIQYGGSNLEDIKPLGLELDHEQIQKVLGHALSVEEMTRILESLDFKVQSDKGRFYLGVPSYRSTRDIDCEADIIEEIGRIVGYDNINPTSPKLDVVPARLSPAQTLHRKMKDFLVIHARAFEINTYAMVGEKLLNQCSWPEKNKSLKLLNGLSKDHDRMRPSLIPSFLEVASLNAKHLSEFRFFELARRYQYDDKEFGKDISQLGIAFFNKEKSPFIELADVVQKTLDTCLIPADLVGKHSKFKSEVVDETWLGLHPFEFYNIRLMGKLKGSLFTLHPLMAHQFKIKGYLSVAIIDLDTVENRSLKEKTRYRPLPKFPSSNFDCTVQVALDVPVANILSSLSKLKIKELVSTTVVDVFKQPSQSIKYVTLRNMFQDYERTLKGDFLKEAEKAIVTQLEKSGFPLKAG